MHTRFWAYPTQEKNNCQHLMYIFQNFFPCAFSFLPSFIPFPSFLFFLFLHKCNHSDYTILHLAFFLPWFQMCFPFCNIILKLRDTNNYYNYSGCGPDMSGAPHTVSRLIFSIRKWVVICSILHTDKLRLIELNQLLNNNQLMETRLVPLILIFMYLSTILSDFTILTLLCGWVIIWLAISLFLVI